MTVITLTMNPSVDKTLVVNHLIPGELHRVGTSFVDAAGKGINVSRVLGLWGVNSRAVAVVGGENGRFIENALREGGIEPHCVSVPGDTRMNVKIMEQHGDRMTELNEPGPVVGEDQLQRVGDVLTALVEKSEGTKPVVVMSGSLPPGAPHTFYARLIQALAGRADVVLDTSGAPLTEGIKARPMLIKPNLLEMETLLGHPLEGPSDWVAACRQIQAAGVQRVVLSLGAEGALFVGRDDEGVHWFKSRPVAVKSLVGCGDTMVASTLYGIGQGFSWVETGRFATAAATAAATLAGTTFPTMNHVLTLQEGVTERALAE